jgi:hypothetical protein
MEDAAEVTLPITSNGIEPTIKTSVSDTARTCYQQKLRRRPRSTRCHRLSSARLSYGRAPRTAIECSKNEPYNRQRMSSALRSAEGRRRMALDCSAAVLRCHAYRKKTYLINAASTSTTTAATMRPPRPIPHIMSGIMSRITTRSSCAADV